MLPFSVSNVGQYFCDLAVLVTAVVVVMCSSFVVWRR